MLHKNPSERPTTSTILNEILEGPLMGSKYSFYDQSTAKNSICRRKKEMIQLGVLTWDKCIIEAEKNIVRYDYPVKTDNDNTNSRNMNE